MVTYTASYPTEIGTIEIIGTDQNIISLGFVDEISKIQNKIPECIKVCIKQLDEYFKGKRKVFSVPLEANGTEFQKKVWKALFEIPYGETRSYKDIAVTIKNEKAVRAVGAANGKNPIGIIIPCHRVIGSDGSLTGYAEGVWRKAWLLEHELKFADL